MILIGLGSNLTGPNFESPKAVLMAALEKMPHYGIKVKLISPFYQTEPIPKSDQPWFVNGVALVETALGAEGLLRVLHDIEETLGRKRLVRWEARIVDLDILAYDEMIYPKGDLWQIQAQDQANNNTPSGMIIPHPRLHERLFVLKPLMDICPDWRHPVFGRTVRQLWDEAQSPPDQGIIQPLS